MPNKVELTIKQMYEAFLGRGKNITVKKPFPTHYKPYEKVKNFSNPDHLEESYHYFYDFYFNDEWYRFVLYGAICYNNGYNYLNLSRIKDLSYECNYVSTPKTLVKKVRIPITEMHERAIELFNDILPYFVKYYVLKDSEDVIDYEIEQGLSMLNGLTNE